MSAHPVDIHVGKRLRVRRSMLGMSQDDLGKEIGVTFQQVQKYERGTNRIGSSRLYDISKALSVPVSFFFEGFATQAANSNVAGLAEDDIYAKEDVNNKETIALVQAYYKISDPTVRSKVTALIKALQTKENVE